jgi:probable F420-dependent oxidoreductase
MTPAPGIGRVGIWGHLDSLPSPDARRYAHRVEELGYGALWVPETVGREPFSLLALLATETRTLLLGTSIASIYARDAVTMRTSAMTLHEATGGRFVLGLGVSHPHLVTKVRGHEYGKPVSAMRDFLAAYRAAPWRGPSSAVGPEGGPPIVVAALRERMASLGATDADGVFPYLVTPERVAWMRSVVDGAAQQAGRPRPLVAVTMPAVLDAVGNDALEVARAYLAPYLRTPNYQGSWSEQGFDPDDWEKPGSDRLVDAMVALGDRSRIGRRLTAFLEAGADHVALIPLGPGGTTEHTPAVEALAELAGTA